MKKKLTEAPILITPNRDLPFELMCDASDFAIGAVLGQRHEKQFKPIHYASKTMNDAESNYTTTEKEMLAVVFGSPRAIISDRGTHFCNDQFSNVMLKYGVTHHLSTAYHLQTSGQVEDCPDCEVFYALSIVLYPQRASHPQLHFGNPDCPDCEVFYALSIVLYLQRASHPQLHFGNPETDTQEKDKNKAQNDKTEHKLEKIEKDKVIRSQKSKVKARGQQKSTPGKSKSTPTKPK
nr:reverse transcriptase domain-containing protein [Tanacetum cinerariifolium]